MFVLRWVVINRLRLVIPTRKHLSTVHSDSAIVNQMKRLNDEKQFDQVLQLFDAYNQKNNSSSLPSRIVTLALKACTEMGDLKHAKHIHHRLSSSNQSDRYILFSLIDCYSKSSSSLLMYTFLVQCASSAIR